MVQGDPVAERGEPRVGDPHLPLSVIAVAHQCDVVVDGAAGVGGADRRRVHRPRVVVRGCDDVGDDAVPGVDRRLNVDPQALLLVHGRRVLGHVHVLVCGAWDVLVEDLGELADPVRAAGVRLELDAQIHLVKEGAGGGADDGLRGGGPAVVVGVLHDLVARVVQDLLDHWGGLSRQDTIPQRQGVAVEPLPVVEVGVSSVNHLGAGADIAAAGGGHEPGPGDGEVPRRADPAVGVRPELRGVADEVARVRGDALGVGPAGTVGVIVAAGNLDPAVTAKVGPVGGAGAVAHPPVVGVLRRGGAPDLLLVQQSAGLESKLAGDDRTLGDGGCADDA